MSNQSNSANPNANQTAAPVSQPAAGQANGALTLQSAQELIAKLQADLAAAQAQQGNGSISFVCHAIGERYTDGSGVERIGKGVMSMRGLGRMPVSLYQSQWRRLIVAVKDGSVEKALEANKSKLAVKGQQ